MNARLALYCSGAPLIVRTVYLPGGRKFHVLNPRPHCTTAARRLLDRGLSVAAAARALGAKRALVRAARPGFLD